VTLPPNGPGHTRRTFLAAGAGALAATGLVPGSALASPRRSPLRARPELLGPNREQLEALRVLGKTSLRLPQSLPNEAMAAGTDTMPEIEHVVVLMMENHSYDNLFGMLGRGPFQLPRGDGFTLAADGYPANSNPQAGGTPLRAFQMPTSCQLPGKPSQEWAASHEQYANGMNNGFVTSPSGPVAMGYWTAADLPFTYSLASHFPVGDRWFCSLLGQTDPNRRFLLAATAMGMTDDIPDPSQDAPFALSPPNGTIFTALTHYGISWNEYASDTSATGESGNLYATDDYPLLETHGKPFAQFLTDAAAGRLPSFSLLDPNYSTQSQENPQNIVLGESFLRSAVEAIGSSPNWRQTILFVMYDEHGGYYDHVPPPVALAPDSVGPVVPSGESTYDGFKRYGFRVPSVVVSPYAKPNYVSHLVYDHTSVLAFLERKFNLPAFTLRDANANDLTDFLDLDAMAKGHPTFPELPALAASGDTASTEACSTTGPGTIPPPRRGPLPIKVAIREVKASWRPRGVAVGLQASRSGLKAVEVELWHGGRRVARHRLTGLGVPERHIVLQVRGKGRLRGAYKVTVVQGSHRLAEKSAHLR
jgi:phospholipase C